MAKSCAGCGYHDAGGDVAECPTCRRGLQVTYLPPPGAPPLALAATTPIHLRSPHQSADYAREDPMTRYEAFRSLLGYRAVVGLALLPLIGLYFLTAGLGPRHVVERHARIVPGMSVADVQAVFDAPARLGQSADRDSTVAAGWGTMTYRNGSAAVVVTVADGRVTGVRLEGVAAPT